MRRKWKKNHNKTIKFQSIIKNPIRLSLYFILFCLATYLTTRTIAYWTLENHKLDINEEISDVFENIPQK